MTEGLRNDYHDGKGQVNRLLNGEGYQQPPASTYMKHYYPNKSPSPSRQNPHLLASNQVKAPAWKDQKDLHYEAHYRPSDTKIYSD